MKPAKSWKHNNGQHVWQCNELLWQGIRINCPPLCFLKSSFEPPILSIIVSIFRGRSFQLQSSVLDRIMTRKERFSWIMLETQYRCHPDIISWSNNSFYEGVLQHHTGGKFLKWVVTWVQIQSCFSEISSPKISLQEILNGSTILWSCLTRRWLASSNIFQFDALKKMFGLAAIVLRQMRTQLMPTRVTF